VTDPRILQARWDAAYDRSRFAVLKAVVRSMPRSERIAGAIAVPFFLALFALAWGMMP
jgi:hypothetical protein